LRFIKSLTHTPKTGSRNQSHKFDAGFVPTASGINSSSRLAVVTYFNKQLITRWDSKREFLRRHRTRTTKYKTYLHEST